MQGLKCPTQLVSPTFIPAIIEKTFPLGNPRGLKDNPYKSTYSWIFTEYGWIGMQKSIVIKDRDLHKRIIPVIYHNCKSGNNLYIYNDVCSYHKGVKTNSKVIKNEELVI